MGTTENVRDTLQEAGVDVRQTHIAYCPERVLPERIMVELLENDRIVGGLTPAATAAVKAFYETFVQGAVLASDARTAEIVIPGSTFWSRAAGWGGTLHFRRPVVHRGAGSGARPADPDGPAGQ